MRIKILAVILLSAMLLSACTLTHEVVDRYLIDARYTPSYQGIETTYDYEIDMLGEETFKLMPDTHTVFYPEKYEVQYRCIRDDGESYTEWVEVARDEYEAAIEEMEAKKK